WKGWWYNLQPAVHHGDTTWPLKQEAFSSDMDWSALERGGCNGLHLVIITLSWW
ncbi:uncharacterized protein LAESUDRAFT_613440, partial [Laetiporus sulphureus 93-53]